MPIPSIIPNMTSGGFPEIPDISNIVDNVQQGIDEVGIPKPPSPLDAGNFLLGAVGSLALKFVLPNPFADMDSFFPPSPSLPAGLPPVPEVPKINIPFKLPF